MTVADARDLWKSTDLPSWEYALETYPSVVEAQEIAKLPDLDRWYTEDLPKIVAERDHLYLDREEISNVVRWKMRRGEGRKRNLVLVRSNRDSEIKEASAEAFALAPDPRKP